MSRDYSQELKMLLAMTPEERSVHFLQEKVDSELFWLEETIKDYRPDRMLGVRGDIGKIREQRRLVQAWQKKLNAAKAKLEKNG